MKTEEHFPTMRDHRHSHFQVTENPTAEATAGDVNGPYTNQLSKK